MANNMPNLTALLGLVAVAGYQNRDKIADFVKGITGGHATAPAATGGLSTSAITGGLGDLVRQFTQNGQGNVASSWVGSGQNASVDSSQLQQALGPDIVNHITATTGLSADELLKRLSQVLPQAVDHMTPNGKLPG